MKRLTYYFNLTYQFIFRLLIVFVLFIISQTYVAILFPASFLGKVIVFFFSIFIVLFMIYLVSGYLWGSLNNKYTDDDYLIKNVYLKPVPFKEFFKLKNRSDQSFISLLKKPLARPQLLVEKYNTYDKPIKFRPFIYILLYFIILRVILVAVATFFLKGTGTSNDNQIFMLAMGSQKFLLAFYVGILAPISEELVFRLGVFSMFNRKGQGLIWSSILFASVHGITSPVEAILYLTMGFALSFIYYKTNDIRYSISVHFLNNLVPAIAILLS